MVELRILMGLCSYRLTEESVAQFLSTPWEVSTEADRIGYRIHGAGFQFRDREPPFGAGSDPSNVVDVGYPVGSIQVPGGKEGILLMRDAVTGGGYATIGTVIQCDLDRVAQAAPRTRFRFRAVTIDEALRLRAQYKSRLRMLADSLALFDSARLARPVSPSRRATHARDSRSAASLCRCAITLSSLSEERVGR